MPHALRDLQVVEMSLVDDPANPGARIELFKRRDDGMPFTVCEDCATPGACKAADTCKLNDVKVRGVDALAVAFKSAMTDLPPDARAAAMRKALDDFLLATREPAMSRETLLKSYDAKVAAIVADPAITDKAKAIREASDALAVDMAKLATPAPAPDDKAKGLTAADIQAEVQKAMGGVAETMKAAVVAAMAPISERIAKLEATGTAAAAELQKMRDDNAAATMLDTLVKNFPHLNLRTNPVLAKSLLGMTEDARKAILDTLTVAENVAKASEGIFTEFGTAGGSSFEAGSVEAKIDAATKAILKDNPALTYAQAQVKAMELDPALYTEHKAARRARAN